MKKASLSIIHAAFICTEIHSHRVEFSTFSTNIKKKMSSTKKQKSSSPQIAIVTQAREVLLHPSEIAVSEQQHTASDGDKRQKLAAMLKQSTEARLAAAASQKSNTPEPSEYPCPIRAAAIKNLEKQLQDVTQRIQDYRDGSSSSSSHTTSPTSWKQ
jgi:hypothetical protein